MPIRLKQLRRQLTEQFTRVDSIAGKQDVDNLLCYCLNLRQAQLLVEDFDLDTQQQQKIKALARRYVTDEEPIDYLLGCSYFMGLKFKVTADVLIPRVDTENLVGWLINYLSAGQLPSRPRVLELGTGSGVIAISLLKNLQDLSVTAVDQSRLALEVAEENAQHLLNKQQLSCLQFLESNWFSAIQGQEKRYEVIVSNPPYVDAKQEGLPRSLSYEPSKALYSAKNGLSDLEKIIQQAPNYLSVGGLLVLEHAFNQATAVNDLLAINNLSNISNHRDLSHRERFTTAFYD